MQYKIKKFNIYEIIYLTFAFDSLLKISLGGFRLHIGVISIILIFFLITISTLKLEKFKSFFKKNWTIFIFVSYIFLHIAFLNNYPGIVITLVYYFLGLTVFYFAYIKEKYISIEAIITFQWIIILNGLFQYALFKLFGYQLAFADATHYMTDASFATRLRGFFLEPNWYSVTITFNTLYFIMKLNKDIWKYKWLLFFTLVCMFFNASYTFIGVLLIGMVIRVFLDFHKISKKRFKLILFLFLIVGIIFSARSYTKMSKTQGNINSSTLVNYGSRVMPTIKTVLYMNNQSIEKQVFGLGLGSWPYVGLEQNQLGYIGVRGEYTIKPAQRDSAELQVFILEVGYLGLFLFLLDYIYNYIKYQKKSFIYALATACMLAAFLVYPIFKFAMYLIPYYLIRAKALNGENLK